MALLPLTAALVSNLGHAKLEHSLSQLDSEQGAFLRNNALLYQTLGELEEALANQTLRGDTLDPAANLARRQPLIEQLDLLVSVESSLISIGLRDQLRAIYAKAKELLQELDDLERQLAISHVSTQAYLADIERFAGVADDHARKLLSDSQNGSFPADSFELISELRFHISVASLSAQTANSTRDATVVAGASGRYFNELRAGIFELSLLGKLPADSQLPSALEALFVRQSAQDNFWSALDTRLSQAGLVAEKRRAAFRTLREVREAAVNMEIENSELLSASLHNAQKALNTSLTASIAAGVVSTIIGLLVLRLYVHRRLVLRIRGLSEATTRLSQGITDLAIDVDGNDELADVQLALLGAGKTAASLIDREERLRRRQHELEALNQELDQFAYVASHDLRAPLRGIDSLASFLQDDLKDSLPRESAKHLQLIRDRIARLESLLSALLEYSRVGRAEGKPIDVDIRQLVNEAAELVVPAQFDVRLTGDFPVLYTPPTPLEQVVRNLLDNAVKHHDSAAGAIEINGAPTVDGVKLSIRDDGPGIDPEYRERIFGMFQTLRPRDNVQGSGMGLAILKKTLEQRGGSIDVLSPGIGDKGCRFDIFWPSQPVADSAHGVSAPSPKSADGSSLTGSVMGSASDGALLSGSSGS